MSPNKIFGLQFIVYKYRSLHTHETQDITENTLKNNSRHINDHYYY